jgi:hypothetical protein
VVTHIKPEGKSWVIDMTPEMAHAANVAEGSLVVLSFQDGDVTAEILPPPGEDLEKEVRQVMAEFGEAFAEMKRRGD